MAIDDVLLPKIATAQSLLQDYEEMYYVWVDVYQVDESALPSPDQLVDFHFYLDYVITKFKSLPKKSIPVRFIEPQVDVEQRELGYMLTTGFRLGVLDSVLRKYQVSLHVGDIVTTYRLFEELGDLKSFEEFTKTAFVRPIQAIIPVTYTLSMQNVLEWELQVSDTDVIFRYLV